MNENTEEKNYLENLNEPEEKELFEESDNLDVPEQYREMEDGELVRLAETDEMALEYLLNKYKYFVRAKARSYFLIGADREDLVQMCIRDRYQSKGQDGFEAYRSGRGDGTAHCGSCGAHREGRHCKGDAAGRRGGD